MRFACESCGKRYVVKGELAPGRTYRSKCKVCGAVILVTGGVEPPFADDDAVVPMPEAPAAVPARTPPPSAPAGGSGYIDLFDGKGLDEPEPARPAPAPRPAAAPIPAPAPREPAPTPVPARTPRRVAPWVIGAGTAILVALLAVAAALRPWRQPAGDVTARVETPDRTVEPPPPAPPPAQPAPTPPPPPPAAADASPSPDVAPPPAPAPAAPAPSAAPPPEPTPPREASAGEKRPGKPDGLSAAAIRKVLAARRRALDRCIDRMPGADRTLPAHRISLRLTVEPGGQVSAVAMTDGEVARAPVGRCLETAARAFSFPPFRGPPALVDVPVTVPAWRAPPAATPAAVAPGATPTASTATAAAAAPAPAATPAVASPAPAAAPPPEPAPSPAPPPAQEPPAGPPLTAVEFADISRTRSGGEIGDTRYSQKPDDATITDRLYEKGVVTWVGQLGNGNGSAYAGFGFWVNIKPGGRPIDASKYRAVTIHLASPTTRALRIRLQGPDQSILGAGCYPIIVLPVSETMRAYRIDFEDFNNESYCGSKARTAEDTLPKLVGFEIADVAVQGKPTRFSVGTITLNP